MVPPTPTPQELNFFVGWKETSRAKWQLPCVCQAFPVNSVDSHFFFGWQRRSTRMHKHWCLFSTLLPERQIWIMCSVVRPGSTGTFNRSSSCLLPRESNDCEIVFFFVFVFLDEAPHLWLSSTRSPSDKPALHCSRPTAGHREKSWQSQSFYFPIVTFLAYKLSSGHKRSWLEFCCQDLCANKKSLLYLLLPCKSVFYYDELFLHTKFDFEILRLRAQAACLQDADPVFLSFYSDVIQVNKASS